MAKKSQEDREKGEPAGAERSDQGPNIPVWLPATYFVGLTLLLFRKFVFSDQMTPPLPEQFNRLRAPLRAVG